MVKFAAFELSGEPCGGIAVLDAQLAPRAVTVGVDRGFRHAQLAGDLLGREVLVDQTQALPLTGREQPDWILGDETPRPHNASSKR